MKSNILPPAWANVSLEGENDLSIYFAADTVLEMK